MSFRKEKKVKDLLKDAKHGKIDPIEAMSTFPTPDKCDIEEPEEEE